MIPRKRQYPFTIRLARIKGTFSSQGLTWNGYRGRAAPTTIIRELSLLARTGLPSSPWTMGRITWKITSTRIRWRPTSGKTNLIQMLQPWKRMQKRGWKICQSRKYHTVLILLIWPNKEPDTMIFLFPWEIQSPWSMPPPGFGKSSGSSSLHNIHRTIPKMSANWPISFPHSKRPGRSSRPPRKLLTP